MKTLDELIRHHRRRERECRKEADRAMGFKDDGLSARAHKQWMEEVAVARDTASWLETIKRRTA